MKNSLLAGKKILVCGANGRSGRAAARLYATLGASVLLSDLNRDTKLDELLPFGRQILDCRPRQDAALLEEYRPDLLVTAPGIALSTEIFQAADRKGLPLRGENDFAAQLMGQLWKKKPYIFAVTGTDGKSTLTALLTQLLQKAAGVKALCGANFGRPLSDIVLGGEVPVLVLECSSFQLELVEAFHPQTALLLNIAEDHTDRYRSQEEYSAAKLNITRCQTAEDSLFFPQELEPLVKSHIDRQFKERRAAAKAYKSEAFKSEAYKSKAYKSKAHRAAVATGAVAGPRLKVLKFSQESNWLFYRQEPLLPVKQLGLVGYHNVCNATFALQALADFEERFVSDRQLLVQRPLLQEVLSNFRGLEHRLEYVTSLKKVGHYAIDFYNDSKATTVQAVQAALKTFSGRPVFLLCGGRNKGGNFSHLTGHYQAIFPFGEAASVIGQMVGKKEVFAGLEEAFAATLQAACNYCRKKSRQTTEKNDKQAAAVFLLSPGCSSFDAYADYIERGKHFYQLAKSAADRAC